MQSKNTSQTRTNIGAELYKRLLIGLFMFLCWKLTAIVLKPIDDGDIKLIMVCLVEIATMVTMAIYFGRSNIVRDVNELNCYALLVHLVYLPAFYFGVMPAYHNNTINILLGLFVARLLYFGPRSSNGDFSGLPVFGLLGHIQSFLEENQSNKMETFFNHLPSVLFFGSSVPVWIIVARSNDLVVTSTVIGLMLFIFAMAQSMHKMINSPKYRNSSANIDVEKIFKEDLPNSGIASEKNVELANFTAQEAIYDFSLKVIGDYHRFHFAAQTGLNQINIYRAKLSLVPLPKRLFSLDEQRRGLLDSVECIGLITKWQLDLKLGLNDTPQVKLFKDRLAALKEDFKREFGEELKDVDVEKYAYIASKTEPFEISDEELRSVCDDLMMAWLIILFRTDDECLGKIDLLHKILHHLSMKFRPEGHE